MACALAGLAACGMLDNPAAIPEPTGGTGGSGGGPPAIVGSWSRTISFYNSQYELNTSQTTWSFVDDSVAWREVVSTNVYWGFSDTTLDELRYHTTAGTLYFRFVTDTSWLQMTYALRGDSLFLGGQAFARVSQ